MICKNRFFRRLLTQSVVVAIVLGFPLFSYAQDAISTVGISGRDDKQQRSPTISVRVVPGENTTKLLIDAGQRNEVYRIYPIQFDIYVNRRLISTQYRSNSLPGPIGIDVGPEQATLPFNYTVVAKVLTPTGDLFTSVQEGAAFASALSGLLDCTISYIGIGGSDYVKNNVDVLQTGNNSIRLNVANAKSIGTSDTLDGTLVATITGDTASGTLTSTVNDLGASRRTETVTGSASSSALGVSSLRLASADGSVSLTCS